MAIVETVVVGHVVAVLLLLAVAIAVTVAWFPWKWNARSDTGAD